MFAAIIVTFGGNMNRVRIGVYAICKNESAFVEKWIENMWCNGNGADGVFILDTGSTDNTVEIFYDTIKKLNIPEGWLTFKQKKYNTWRFDTPRNDNMDMMNPEDFDVFYCIDLDELVIPDFWQDLRECVKAHPDFERIYYRYAWSHDNETNEPKNVFWYDKIHSTKGWRWQYPVHEALVKSGVDMYHNYSLSSDKIYLHHYPDQSKSRSSYLPLLKLRTEEYPDDVYGLYYLQREYTFVNDYENALKTAIVLYTRLLGKHINDDYHMLPSTCVSIANYFRILGLKDDAETYYRKAIKFDSSIRDGYMELAQMLAYSGRYQECYDILDSMDKNSVRTEDWRVVPYYWRDWKKYQIIGCAKCWEEKYDEAEKLFKLALEDIKTEDDKKDALRCDFYNDYIFVLNKLNKS